jgi:hypothetical protein
MYALAASAAGVGVLALAQCSQATIVYTHAHYIIQKPFNLDLNHDGRGDFRFVFKGSPHTLMLSVRPVRHTENEVWGTSETHRGSFYASALNAGVVLGSSGTKFNHGHDLMFQTSSQAQRYYFGLWRNVQNRYLGLKFRIQGKVHYGWARLSILNSTSLLTGYAYETIPGKAITAGKTKEPEVITLVPDSLGRLAQGSAGRLGK